jgi:hypothetical protein
MNYSLAGFISDKTKENMDDCLVWVNINDESISVPKI